MGNFVYIIFITQIDATKGELVETAEGDIIIFNALTPHQSSTNTANKSRRQVYLTYSPERNGDMYEAHYKHYREYYLAGKLEETRKQYFFK